MFGFLGELLIEFLIGFIVNVIFAALWWVVRTAVLLALYPLMLLMGWVRMWVRAPGRTGFVVLWQKHGPVGLHRFGWAEVALDVEYFAITVLLLLVAAGIGVLIYSVGIRVSLWGA
jgi:hypothetical protein